MKADGWVWTTPLVVNDRLYFGDLQGSVFAVDAATGDVQWKVQPVQESGSVRANIVLTGEGTLIVAVDDITNGTVVALNIADGSEKWRQVLDPQNADRMLSNPVVMGDTVLIVPLNADQLVYALNVGAGDTSWTFKP